MTPVEAARSKPLCHAGPAQIALATILAVLVLVAAAYGGQLPVRLIFILPATAAALALLAGWRFHVRAGGLTGDFLGATQQLLTIALLLVWALACGRAGA